MKIKILDKAKKKKILEQLSYLGVERIPGMLVKTGKEKVNLFSGILSKEELMALWRVLPVEGIGLYFGKEFVDRKSGDKQTRLSLDAVHVLKNQIKKNIVKLNKMQEENWFRGKNIGIGEGQVEKIGGGNFISIVGADGKDFIGTGKLTHDKKIILNYLPKERRRR